MILKINKKAVIGKGIVAFPVFFFVLIIMSSFLLLTATTTILKPIHPQQASLINSPEENLLIQTIEIELENGSKKELLVYDALHLIWQDTELFSRNKLTTTIAEQLLTEKNNCYVLDFPPIWRWSGWELEDSKVKRNPTLEYIEQELLTKTKMDAKQVHILSYYYGACPNE